MKFKTWEKWYWGVDLAIMIFVLIGYHTNTDPKNYVMNINGVPRPMTATEAYSGAFIIFVGVMGLLWLIIRYFVNRGDDKKDN